MSKKLLMNNYSSNGLMPVMDGLVCWLDGRDYEFIDRTGNFEFETTNITSDGKKFIFNGVDSIAKYIGDIPIDVSNCSVNIILKILKDNSTYRFITIGKAIVALDSNGVNTHQTLSCNIVRFFKSKDMNKIEDYCVTGNLARDILGYYEGVRANVVSCGNGYDLNPLNSIVIGGRLNSNYAPTQYTSMELCSIKIYNRVLTEEEVYQNYLYEQSIERGE